MVYASIVQRTERYSSKVDAAGSNPARGTIQGRIIMPSNVTYTCIPCRFSAKQTAKCPYCHKAMTYMGKAFKPPRKTNNSQWVKVAMLVEHDIRFGYCSCHRFTRSLRTVAEAKNKVGARKSKNYAKVTDVRTQQIQQRITWEGREFR
jgi:hypothetical protein